jgi:protein O-GlcNAc transferase
MQINYLYQQAIQLIQNQCFDEAEIILLKIYKVNKNIPEVISALGFVSGMKKKHKDAIKYFKNAIQLTSTDPNLYINLANAYDEIANFQESIKCYKKAIALGVNTALVWLGVGKAYFETENYQSAINAYEKSVKLNPNDYKTWYNLGIVYFKKGNFEEALKKFHLSAKHHLNDSVYISIGDCEYALKNYKKAIENYDLALKINPQNYEIYNAKAATYTATLSFHDAFESCTKSLNIKPLNIKGLSNLGIILRNFRRYKDAIGVFDEVLKQKPNDYDVIFNKAQCLELIHRFDESLKAYEKVFHINPFHDQLSGLYINAQLRTYSWRSLHKNNAYLQKIIEKDVHVSMPFLYLSSCNVQTQYLIAKKFSDQSFSISQSLRPQWKAINRKIRVGYFSSDFRDHPVSRLTVELFELHNRQKFEVIGISLRGCPEDHLLGQRVRKAFDKLIDIEELSTNEKIKKIKELEIDIAIDLGGHTEGSPLALFAEHIAPIQISYIGNPGTTGAKFIDYIIADKILIPASSQKYYSEKIIYMPNCFQINDSKRDIPDYKFSNQELQLPENSIVYCCFNNTYKVNPTIFDVWIKILLNVPNSVLWLLVEDSFSQANLLEEIKKRKVNINRFIFASRANYEEYLSRFKNADLFLDTLPFNAGTTASDALWMGLPVLTCLGDSYAGRMAASLLNSLQIPELITNNLDEYLNLAIELGKNPQKITKLKNRIELNRNNTPLFNSELFVNHLENAFHQIYENYFNDISFEHIYAN